MAFDRTANCVSSPDFDPQMGKEYGNDEGCSIEVTEDVAVTARYFSTEAGFDFLTIDGVAYDGSGSSSQCRWTDDGECDEWWDVSQNTAGLGLCADGTDVADCGCADGTTSCEATGDLFAGVDVATGSMLEWWADGSITDGGFELCVDGDRRRLQRGSRRGGFRTAARSVHAAAARRYDKRLNKNVNIAAEAPADRQPQPFARLQHLSTTSGLRQPAWGNELDGAEGSRTRGRRVVTWDGVGGGSPMSKHSPAHGPSIASEAH